MTSTFLLERRFSVKLIDNFRSDCVNVGKRKWLCYKAINFKNRKIKLSTKAVRFSKEETEEINEFLSKNSFLDFSTLTRIAIKNFMKNPAIEFELSNVKISQDEFKDERNQND